MTCSANERLLNTMDRHVVGHKRRWVVGLGWPSWNCRRGSPSENKTKQNNKKKHTDAAEENISIIKQIQIRACKNIPQKSSSSQTKNMQACRGSERTRSPVSSSQAFPGCQQCAMYEPAEAAPKVYYFVPWNDRSMQSYSELGVVLDPNTFISWVFPNPDFVTFHSF